jgi:hypothetical protein
VCSCVSSSSSKASKVSKPKLRESNVSEQTRKRKGGVGGEREREREVLSWVLAGVNAWDVLCGYRVVGI